MKPSFKHAIAVAASTLALSSQATTVTFDSLLDSYTFLYSATIDGATMSSSVTYKLTAWNNKNATMSVSATNSSSGVGHGLHPIRMVSFGVAFTNPDLTSANVAGVGEWDAQADTRFPGGDTVVQLCEYAGQNCLDDTGLGVWEGATDTFNLSLSFANRVEGNSISFSSPFESKWQGVGNANLMYAVTGCLAGTDCISEVSQIPEPTSLALGGLALLGAFAARRRSA